MLFRSSVLLLLLFLLARSSGAAQPFQREITSPAVTAGGTAIALPFAGGIDSPQHQFADIDGDGDLDLFVFDTDQATNFYRNTGSAQQARFALEPGAIALPPFQYWFLFIDIDRDGKLDLAADDSSSGVKIFLNQGTLQIPDFLSATPSLLHDTTGAPVFAGFSSIPAFTDIDADGDLDFLSGNSLNGSVNHYRNLGGTPVPRYSFVTDNFQGIMIIGDSCMSGGMTNISTAKAESNKHGVSAFRFADIDGNGTYDFFFGDLFAIGLFFLENTGTPAVPHIVCRTARYPYDQPVITGGFNMPVLVDIDADQDLDLFIGLLGGIVQRHGFWFIENVGDALFPNFMLRTKNYLSHLDVGKNAHPSLVDIDGDNDLDLFSGNLNGDIWLYRNTGSVSAPAFTLVDTAFAAIKGNFEYAPVFVDIDADAARDYDLFTVQFNGRMKFYRNTGDRSVPTYVHQPSPVDTMPMMQSIVPAFTDIDGDGDFDLFIGKQDGTVSFYRNNGDASTFVPVLVSADFTGMSVGENAKPAFTDIDTDGDVDLFVGSFDGKIFAFRNTGSATSPQFVRDTLIDPSHDPVKEGMPAFADIDNDGDADFFVGTSKGGIHFYRNKRIQSAAGEEDAVPGGYMLGQNYPNPFNPKTHIQFTLVPLVASAERDFASLSNTQWVTLKIYTILGEEVATLVDEARAPGSYTVSWDAGVLPNGVYYYRLTAGSFTEVKSMILMK